MLSHCHCRIVVLTEFASLESGGQGVK